MGNSVLINGPTWAPNHSRPSRGEQGLGRPGTGRLRPGLGRLRPAPAGFGVSFLIEFNLKSMVSGSRPAPAGFGVSFS